MLEKNSSKLVHSKVKRVFQLKLYITQTFQLKLRKNLASN